MEHDTASVGLLERPSSDSVGDEPAGSASPKRGSLWHRHPGVRSGAQLTRGERAADRLRNGMGSWAFVFAALVFLAGWMLDNRSNGFDPYPFILLNLVLSCLAAMQGAILLIAAKRQDQISSELAAHDYQTNVEADEIVKAIHGLTSDIHARVCGGSSPATANDALGSGSHPQSGSRSRT